MTRIERIVALEDVDAWRNLCYQFSAMSLWPYLGALSRKTVPISLVVTCLNAAAQPVTALVRQFPPGAVSRLEDLPAGTLRSRLQSLQPAAQDRALSWLKQVHFTEQDLPSLRADGAGGVYYACDLLSQNEVALTEPLEPPVTGEAAVPISPLPAHLLFHSRPGAPNVLFLNFSGETVTSTAWNTDVGRTSIPAVAFSTDGDFSTFSDAEQLVIKQVWQRVAEDFAAFDVDVTTERPASFNNRTAHALITRNTDANGAGNPSSTAGGVAYVNVFGSSFYANYRPAWIYYNNLASKESYLAEATSHEVGHNLGLSHDGKTDGSDYYGGHGSGETSWAPLMGTGYNRNVSQWSKGEYYLANNTQDDLSTIAGKTSYRSDDHGDTRAAATPLSLSNATNVLSTTPELDPENLNPANKGVLERNSDVDVFSFVTGSGPVQFTVSPWIMATGTRGGNLDLTLELYNEAGSLLETANPATQTAASLQATLIEGRYYLLVRNAAAGDPMSANPSGYTRYGCVGQYFVNGQITASTGGVLPPVAELQVADLNQEAQTSNLLTVTYFDDLGIEIASIDSQDIRITGPRGYDRLARLVSVDRVNNGTPCVATYAVGPASDEVWLPADNGTYRVWMQTNEVASTQNAWVSGGLLGQFQVAVPQVIFTANLSTDPDWNMEGQWAYGLPDYSGPGPTSGRTGSNILAFNLSGNYDNSLAPQYVTTSPIDCTGTTALTLRFQRWLGLRNRDTVNLQVSTNGTSWVTVWSTSSEVSDDSWQEVQHSLPQEVAGSPTLRLRWGLESNRSQNGIGWNLDDIQLLGDGSLDTSPPVASLLVNDLVTGASPSHSCTVVYADDSAVRVSSLDGQDLLVTGPHGYSNLADFVGADITVDGTPCTASYAMAAPDQVWRPEDNGTYQVLLLGNQIEDVFNNAVAQQLLGSFEVQIPAVLPGQLELLPADELVYSGVTGGPFSPSSRTCILTNSGGSVLNWTVSSSEDWSILLPEGGPLEPGESVLVTISLAPSTEDLQPGSHTNVISFLNTTTGIGNAVRDLILTVTPPPSHELSIAVNMPAWGRVSPTNASGAHPVGTTLELSALPSPYFEFQHWAGDVSSTNNPLTLVLNTNLSLLAVFAELLTVNHPTPHWWLAELGYTNNYEVAVTNLGANGMPLWESYVAGLDPENPASQLQLHLLAASPAVLSWQTVSNRTYTLHASTNGGWTFHPLAGATDLPAAVSSFTNLLPSSAPTVFYRLEVR